MLREGEGEDVCRGVGGRREWERGEEVSGGEGGRGERGKGGKGEGVKFHVRAS